MNFLDSVDQDPIMGKFDPPATGSSILVVKIFFLSAIFFLGPCIRIICVTLFVYPKPAPPSFVYLIVVVHHFAFKAP